VGTIGTKPITVEDFKKLDLPEDREWELQNGEVVEMSLPKLVHRRLQHRIQKLCKQAFPDAAVLTEYPFEVQSSNDLRSADVGVTTKQRAFASTEKGALIGAPELVVEVLSPSNSVYNMKRYRRLCFENGTQVFLLVDPDDNTVEVHLHADKQDRVLRPGEVLTLCLFGEQKTIPVAAIFAGITLPSGA